MPPDDPHLGGTETAHGLDIGLLPDHEGTASRQSRHGRHIHHRQGKNYIFDVRAQHCHQRNGEQGTGNGLQAVTDSHDNVVCRRIGAGVEAQHHAEEAGKDAHQKTDGEGNPCAVKHPGEHVPAHGIGAEKMLSAAGLQPVHRIQCQRVIAGEHRCQNGQNNDQQHHNESEHGCLVFCEAADPQRTLLLGQPFLQLFKFSHSLSS